ncbi:extradiol dioxygenase [Pseudoduganella aquatica]|uniref:Extradiol dioxygenase n=1 Tax=Pseudoduganella aquatica TaxID=2660641 RepID=A0A7X4HA86_9BURK|nr:extradiol dioxygenase [Pseudoduganella aquatica]MYN06530.1 extradiol dioxygenase [Pseudoduganella aquatica]
MQLDHVTIVAPDCAPLRRFFVHVAGMEEGARPAFGVGGHWLYLDGRPVLHLIERPDAQSGPRKAIARAPARIDHLALRLDSAAEWQALLRRLDEYQVPYQLSDMRALREQQLFVALGPEITVEFVIAAQHLG